MPIVFTFSDWGEASEAFDAVKDSVAQRDLTSASEAQTRFDVLDRMVREVLGWKHGQVSVEEYNQGARQGYVDYLLRSGDQTIVIEAKRAGAAFPSPTRRSRLKLSGTVLGTGEIHAAITQAQEYAITKEAEAVVVTNGLCWCFYPTDVYASGGYAHLLFPFDQVGDAERLFSFFSVLRVEGGSLDDLFYEEPLSENRLVGILRDSDARIDRNTIADHIAPALRQALYADALLSNREDLEKCFVRTEARTKFDSLLGIHLADPKPDSVSARRIRTGRERGELDTLVRTGSTGYAPPVTLIMGPVGVGKSTYLKHFELISGQELLAERKAHWIYVDFESLGKEGNPRRFLYEKLRDYLLADHPDNPTDYRSVVEPAYAAEIASLARGPYALIYTNKEEFNRVVTDHIRRDYDAIEPYVDKVFKYIAGQQLCVVVLDNIDLYEDDELETRVFSEGLALSKRMLCNVIVTIRDTTFVRHRDSSVFNAYELQKLWLDPPPFKAVLSRRLTYSKKILENRSARLRLSNGATVHVPDMSVFFEIAHTSMLSGRAGDFVDAMADLDIRKGLTLVRNFLTSGHVEADRAIQAYMGGNTTYRFPFHEIFKGTTLAQWKNFREDRAECLNLFDSRLGSKSARLLRLMLLRFLELRARNEDDLEVPVSDCTVVFSRLGVSSFQLVGTLTTLANGGLIRSVDAQSISVDSRVAITRSGAYYIGRLCKALVYAEECMYDTAIDDSEIWNRLAELTIDIESERSRRKKIHLRRTRIENFLAYLSQLEQHSLGLLGQHDHLRIMPEIRSAVESEVSRAIRRTYQYYAD